MLKLNDELDEMVGRLEDLVLETIGVIIFETCIAMKVALDDINADPRMNGMLISTMTDMNRDIVKSMMDIISVVAALSDKEYYNLLKEDPNQFESVIKAVIKSMYPIRFPKKEETNDNFIRN